MSTEFINFLAPPGHAIDAYKLSAPASAQEKGVPSTFVEAMTVREAVFVQEQQLAPESELDKDDARSFHWVVYASVSNPSAVSSNGRKGSQTSTVPVGTVRLVPPPHAEHGHGADSSALLHDGREPYVKLGRLATLRAYRGLGLARLLVDTALEWASKHPDAIVPRLSPTSREAAKVEAGIGERERRWKGLVLVHSQVRVEGVYRKMGFETDQGLGVWDEEGIPHVGMWKRIEIEDDRPRR
ncbi:MAG: hypothetical protein M1832_000720 [Thelocarpon impressellum]|nr:MAG: hypothetical protein M1832_000720 [Thelocarpon impressellum]